MVIMQWVHLHVVIYNYTPETHVQAHSTQQGVTLMTDTHTFGPTRTVRQHATKIASSIGKFVEVEHAHQSNDTG